MTAAKAKNELMPWDGCPETIQQILCEPPVLPHEIKKEFYALFDSFREYAKPENIIDYHLVYTATVCKWETTRYRFMAVAATFNQQQAGVASLFEQANESAFSRIGKVGARADARRDAKKYFRDLDYRLKTDIEFETYGYKLDGQAFLLSLPSLATIERLLASAEKRYVATMKELEKRMASRAAKPVLAVVNELKAKTEE